MGGVTKCDTEWECGGCGGGGQSSVGGGQGRKTNGFVRGHNFGSPNSWRRLPSSLAKNEALTKREREESLTR